MRTSEQCLAKAVDLEREARLSKSDVRRQAFLELADQWRRLAEAQARTRAHVQVEAGPRWARRQPRVN